MKAYQAERKFLYFEKRHFLFLSRMSFLCMRRSDPQERRSRTLKAGIDFKPNSKTFRYILNHNNNKISLKALTCVCEWLWISGDCDGIVIVRQGWANHRWKTDQSHNRNTDPKEYVLSVLWESTKYSRNPFRVCEGFFLKYRLSHQFILSPK